MKIFKTMLFAALSILLMTACDSISGLDNEIDTDGETEYEEKIEEVDWLSELLNNSTEYPLPSIRQKAINKFMNSPYAKSHKLLAISHLYDNRITLLTTTNETEKYNVEYWTGLAYNDISDNIVEQEWDVPNSKKSLAEKEDYVKYNILFPYKEQGIVNIESVIDYIHTQFDEFKLFYVAAYYDYYVLNAIESTGKASYTDLYLFIDYEGNLLEAEKYIYDGNQNHVKKYIEYVKMENNDSSLLSRSRALDLLKPSVELLEGQDFGDGSIRNINGREYYLFTVFSEYTVDAGYCVDIITGELFYCDEELILTPIPND